MEAFTQNELKKSLKIAKAYTSAPGIRFENEKASAEDSSTESLSIDGNQKKMIRTTKEAPFNLYFNKNNLVVLIDDKQKLTIAERERLRELMA